MLIETAVLYILVRFVLKRKDVSTTSIIFAGLFASFATIPYVWFVFPYVRKWDRSVSFLFSEPFVFVVEAVFYNFFLRLGWKNSFATSLLCNTSSYFMGPALRSVGLWIYW